MALCDAFLPHGTYALLNARGGTALDLACLERLEGHLVHYRANQQVRRRTALCGVYGLAHATGNGNSSVRGSGGRLKAAASQRRESRFTSPSRVAVSQSKPASRLPPSPRAGMLP